MIQQIRCSESWAVYVVGMYVRLLAVFYNLEDAADYAAELSLDLDDLFTVSIVEVE